MSACTWSGTCSWFRGCPWARRAPAKMYKIAILPLKNWAGAAPPQPHCSCTGAFFQGQCGVLVGWAPLNPSLRSQNGSDSAQNGLILETDIRTESEVGFPSYRGQPWATSIRLHLQQAVFGAVLAILVDGIQKLAWMNQWSWDLRWMPKRISCEVSFAGGGLLWWPRWWLVF